jgi:RND superfamily putative drug exporter
MRTLAQWCFLHRRTVLVGWLIALIGLSALSKSVGTDYSDSFSLPNTQSTQALNLIKAAAPQQAGDSDQIVFATTAGSVNDAAVRGRLEPMLARVSALPHVAKVSSPYTSAGARQISSDGKVAFATITFDDQANLIPKQAVDDVVATARAAGGDGVQVELGGAAIEQANRPSVGSVGYGVIAAGIVLFLVFGSLLGMVLPLLTAVMSLGAGLGAIGLLSNAMNMASFTSQLASLIGLGVGVDYALFIVSRYRQGLLAGKDPREAAVTAVDTSGRAVVFAGITVCIALMGMFALGLNFLYGLAVASSLAVLFTVLAAITLLPALLGFFGTKVLPRRQRRAIAAGTVVAEHDSPRWTAWAGRLKRRPAAFAALGIIVMGAIAVPFFSLRLGSSDQGNDPSSTTTRQAYDLLARGFGPGFNGPLQIVAPITGPAGLPEVAKIVDVVGREPGVAAVTPPVVLGQAGGPQVAVAAVYPTTSPQDEATSKLVKRLRDHTIPAASAGSGQTVLVGGTTAIFDDFSTVIAGKLPLFIGVVVLLSFLLLMAVFRSLVIPATAAVMNLLSAGAAFGVVTAVFQWGWGAHLIGVGKQGPIEAFLPVMVFAILFGLSMDYEVFLVSRMHEEWQKSGDNDHAVGHGLAATARTITAAAVIMVLVFGAFILGGERVIKLFGLGLASAVLLDALIVRSVIVPALMFAFGKSNWALPQALDRALPRLSVEPAEQAPDELDDDLAAAVGPAR